MMPRANALAGGTRQFTRPSGGLTGPQIGSNVGRTGGMPGRQIAGLPQGTTTGRGFAPRTPGIGRTAPTFGGRAPSTMIARAGQGGLRAISPQVRPASQGLTSWVRGSNQAGRIGANAVRPGVGTPGTTIPQNARNLDFSRVGARDPAVRTLRQQVGDPQNRFAFNPRHNMGDSNWNNNWGRNGEWHGDHDGFHHDHEGFHHDHDEFFEDNDDFFFGFGFGTLFASAFWYPYYYSNPWWFGFGYPGYYPSIYSYWGWTPGWVMPSQVSYEPSAPVYISQNPYTYYGVNRDEAGAQQAINDIRTAWLTGNANLIAAHLSDQLDIRVAFNGQYSYTTSSKDYYGMTLDAIGTSKVVSMDFANPVWISDSDVLYTGKQVFYSPDNTQHTVYLSYRLANVNGNWYIVGIGSSLQPVSPGAAQPEGPAPVQPVTPGTS
jgi:hypothetical protein